MENMSLEALNKVPQAFNNNILWNFGHSIASQQLLCYKLAKLEPKMPMELILKYRKGTKPESYIEQEELSALLGYSDSTMEALIADYENGLFSAYSPYTTSYGVDLATIEDAIKFVSVHDGLHYGYAMALKRLVNQ